MRTLKSLFMALLLLCSTAVMAQSFKAESIYYNVTSSTDKTVEVTKNPKKYTDAVVIPATVIYNNTTYSVTSIGENAFYECSALTSIEIPNSVTSIGNSAFSGCSSLTSIVIPNSVTSIGNSAFSYCRNLTSIVIPNSITSIGENTFYLCSALASIEIPNSVISIGNSAFSSCSSLTSIEIPNSVTSIGYNAFSNCSSLTSIVIPNSVTSIEGQAFYKCSALASIVIPNSVTSIGENAFFGCDGLKKVELNCTNIGTWFCFNSSIEEIVIGDSVTNIGDEAFRSYSSLASIVVKSGNTKYDSRDNCNAIIETATKTLVLGCKNTTIPNNVTSIGEKAFYGCSALTSIEIPNSVTSIGEDAFLGCDGLTSVVIPNSVTSIGNNAFFGCNGLKIVHNNSSLNIIAGSGSHGYVGYYAAAVVNNNDILDKVGDFTFYISGSTVSLVEYTGKENAVSLPASYNGQSYTIGRALFYNNSNITSITIPNSVTSIVDYMFNGCTSLTSVEIPNSVTSIGEKAFYECSALASIEIPNSVTSIGEQAFSGCTSLTSVEIPNSVTSIGNSAFSNCTSLTSIEIPNSVTSIESGAFGNCTSLASIEIPNSVTSIEYYMFKGCTSLTSVVIPNSVTSIGEQAFYNCSALASIVIPNSVTSIGNYAFYNCSALASIEIPNSVTSIGREVFYNCSALTSIVIPNSVTSIGEYAFYQSKNLRNVTIGSGITHIASNAFLYCGVTDLTMYAMIPPTLGDNVFFEDEYSDKATKVNLTVPEGANYLNIDWLRYCSIQNVEHWTDRGDNEWGVDDNIEWYVDNNSNAIAIGSGNAKLKYCPYEVKRLYIEGGISSIASGAFSNNNSLELEEVYINCSVSSIPDNAFANCENLKTVCLNKNITTIGNNAFGGCRELRNVVLPLNLTSIGNNAFYECRELRNVALPLNLTTIGEYAFYGVPFEFVVIPSQVTSIGYNAFSSTYDYDNGIWNNVPVLVFKSFVAPTMAGFDDYPEICVPVGANSYPSGKFSYIYYYESQQECYLTNSTMYVFGNADKISADSNINGNNIKDVEKVLFTPDATGYNLLPLLPNVKHVDVLNNNPEDGQLYSKDGSNAVFQYRNHESSATILVAGCAATVIPEGTTKIEEYAFYGCEGLKNIEIPSSVKHIGYNAFYGCTGLTSVTLPYGIEDFGSRVFENCTGLKSVVINGGIGYETFYNCTGFTDITVGKMASGIDGSDFYNCKDLTNITVDKECLLYDDRDNCNAIIEKASNKLILASKKTVIPNSVTSISGNAFHAQADMDLTIPETVKSIDTYAFNGVNRLYFESETPAAINGNIFGWGAIYVPVSAYETYCNANVWSDYKNRIVTTEIAEKSVEVYSTEGMSGVLDAIGLNEVDKVVKLKVKGEINSYDIIVFRDKMPLLNDLDLSEATVVASNKPFYQTYCTGKNSLGGYAFYNLDKLISVKLPKELKVLGGSAFYGCEKLTTVDASLTDEINIGVSAFEWCSNLENFVSPQKINNINSNAFKYCNKLKNIELRNISGSIGKNAFYGANIENLNIDSIGGNIESYAFKECSNLQNINVGAMAGSLENYAFAYCTSLKNVEFGKGPAKIGSEVFAFSDSLVNFVAGECVEEVSDYAFRACKSVTNHWGMEEKFIIPRPELKKVVLPNSVQRIGKGAFYQCTSLSDFAIPQKATDISEEAFYNCSSLISVNIPEGTTTINPSTFYVCSSLRNITFPKSLTTISNNAFRYCAFQHLELPPTIKTIGDYAFYGCSYLSELHIPSSVENIGSNAFGSCYKLNDVYTYTVEPTTITETTFSTFGTATLHVPETSFWNYYWNIGWSRFDHKNFKYFNEPYDYFYLNNDYYLNGENGYIDGNPDADMRPGSGLIVSGKENNGEDTKQNLGNVNVESDGEGNSASIIGDEKLHIDNLNVKINVKGNRWYFFAFPWDVKRDRISMENGSDYVFRYYDGEERAKNGNGGWKNVNEPHLKAARGYIFQSSADDVLVLSIEDVKFKKEDKYNELLTHVSDNINDASWNLMGNPYLSYYDMAEMDYTAPVTVWDGSKYVAIRPGDDDYQFTPYEAFFVQKPEGQESVEFGVDGQLTKTEGETAMEQKAAARRVRGIDLQRLLVNIVLSDGETDDRARVVFNERQTHNYETACDAAKFETAGVPQIYTIDDDGVRYAINERPVGNGVVFIGYAAPIAGYYTIEVPRMDTKVFLYDAETGEKHYFEDGAYSFYSPKGTFEKRFSLGVRNDETTGVEGIEEIIDELNGESGNVKGKIYDLHGRKLERTDRGIYIINGEKVVK